MKHLLLGIVLSIVSIQISLANRAEPRNILQNKAAKIDLEIFLVEEFSEVGFPSLDSREFWENLPANLKGEYIKQAESKLSYDWPVVKATDYLEFIRSGDRRQEVYAAPRSAL